MCIWHLLGAGGARPTISQSKSAQSIKRKGATFGHQINTILSLSPETSLSWYTPTPLLLHTHSHLLVHTFLWTYLSWYTPLLVDTHIPLSRDTSPDTHTPLLTYLSLETHAPPDAYTYHLSWCTSNTHIPDTLPPTHTPSPPSLPLCTHACITYVN